MQPRRGIEIRLIVEVRRAAPGSEQQAVGAVAAGDEAAVTVDVGDIGTDLQVVEYPVRAVEPDGNPVELVVAAGDDAPLIGRGAGEKERGSVVAARNRQC